MGALLPLFMLFVQLISILHRLIHVSFWRYDIRFLVVTVLFLTFRSLLTSICMMVFLIV